MKHKINIQLSKDTPPETVFALSVLLKAQNRKGNKTLYLSNEDIEKLNARYETLYKDVKNSMHLSTEQINAECETLLNKYYFEIEELSAYRKAEYKRRQARAEAKNDEQIPWRKCWIRRLLFLPVTNRAQDIIEEEAELEADKLFTSEEKKLDELASKLYGENGKKLSKRRRKKALKKYLKYKRLLNLNEEAAIERFEAALDIASENVPPFTEPTEPPAPPVRKPRKAKQQLGVEPLLKNNI